MAEKKTTKKTTASTAKKTVNSVKAAPKKANNSTRKVSATNNKKNTTAKAASTSTKTQNANLASSTNRTTTRRSGGRWLLFLIPILLLVAAGIWFTTSYVKTDSDGEVYISNTRRFNQDELKSLETGTKDGMTYQEVVDQYGEPTKKTQTTLGNVKTVVATWNDENSDDDKEKENTGVILYFQGSGDLNDLRLTSKIGTYSAKEDDKNSKKNSSKANSTSSK